MVAAGKGDDDYSALATVLFDLAGVAVEGRMKSSRTSPRLCVSAACRAAAQSAKAG